MAKGVHHRLGRPGHQPHEREASEGAAETQDAGAGSAAHIVRQGHSEKVGVERFHPRAPCAQMAVSGGRRAKTVEVARACWVLYGLGRGRAACPCCCASDFLAQPPPCSLLSARVAAGVLPCRSAAHIAAGALLLGLLSQVMFVCLVPWRSRACASMFFPICLHECVYSCVVSHPSWLPTNDNTQVTLILVVQRP